MAKNKTFVRDEVFPSWWPNAVQEFLATLITNLELRKSSATAVEVPAAAGDDQVSLGIDGKWRYRSGVVTRSHPGGAAGTYDVFVVAAENNVVNTPLPYTDATDYAWDLRVVPGGTSPALSAGVVDFFRKIGEVEWDGAAITYVRQTAGPNLTLPVQSRARRADEIPARITGFAGQTADLLRVEDSASARLVGIDAAGRLTFGSAQDTNLYRSAADTLRTDDNFDAALDVSAQRFAAGQVVIGARGPGGEAGLQFGTAIDTSLYRSAVNTLKTGGLFRLGGDTLASRLFIGDAADGANFTSSAYSGINIRTSGATSDLILNAGAGNQILKGAGRLQIEGGTSTVDLGLFFTAHGTTFATDTSAFIFRAPEQTGGDLVQFSSAAAVKATMTRGGQWQLPVTGSGGGLLLGADANLYRSAASVLKTDGTLEAVGNINAGASVTAGAYVQAQAAGANLVTLGYNGATSAPAMTFGSAHDTNLYRSSANVLTTDDSFIAGGGVGTGVTPGGGEMRASATITAAYFAAGKTAIGSVGPGGVEPGVRFGSAADTNLYRSAADTLKTDDEFRAPLVMALPPTTGSWAFRSQVTGDASTTWGIEGGGRFLWGDGGGTWDTNLYRSSADLLRTDDAFHVAGAFLQSSTTTYLGGAVLFGPSGGAGPWDANLYRYAADVLKTDDAFDAVGDITADRFLAGQVVVGARGPGGLAGLQFGTAVDTNLYRAAADTLKTDDAFQVGGAFLDLVHATPAIRFGVSSDASLTRTAAAELTVSNVLKANSNIQAANSLVADRNDKTALILNGAAAGLTIAGDTNLYRYAANVLKTDDTFLAAGSVSAFDGTSAQQVQIGGPSTPIIYFGGAQDTNLYRSSADTLKTDDSLYVGGSFFHLGSQLTFFGGGAANKATVTGSRGGNAALGSLLTGLANYGLITDSSTA